MRFGESFQGESSPLPRSAWRPNRPSLRQVLALSVILGSAALVRAGGVSRGELLQPGDETVIIDEPEMGGQPDMGGGCAPGSHYCGGTCYSDGDPAHCGGACLVCYAPAHATATCVSGACSFNCDAGYQPDGIGGCVQSCSPGFHSCGRVCVSTSDPNQCGPSCISCFAPANGTAVCVSGVCDFVCNPGFRADGFGQCVPDCGAGAHLCGSACYSDSDAAHCGPFCIPCYAPPGLIASCVGGQCNYTVPPSEHPIPFRAGSPKPWEDVGMWSETDEFGVSPGGNLLNRIPLFSWEPPGVGLPIVVALYHNSAEGQIQHGAGYGFRLGVAATLSVGSGDVVTIEEPDGTPRKFNPLGGGNYRSEPGDSAKLTLAGSTYTLDERLGNKRLFENPNGIGFVERFRKDRVNDTVTFNYDTGNNILNVTDSASRQAVFTRTGGFYTQYRDPEGRNITPVYQSDELRNVRLPAVGGQTPSLNLTYWLQGDKHVIGSRTSWGGGGVAYPTTSFTYQSDGSFESVTFPDTSTTRMDSWNGTVTMTDSLGRKTSQVFWLGAVAELIQPDGLKMQWARDSAKRVIQQLDQFGRMHTFTYNATDDVIEFRDPLNRLTTFGWDARHNQTSVQRPGESPEAYTYDAFDLVKTFTNTISETTTYNRNTTNGNLDSVVAFGRTRYSAIYNALGHAIRTAGQDGRETVIDYDTAGINWRSITAPSTPALTRDVTIHGRTNSVTNPLSETSGFRYDTLGRTDQVTLPSTRTITQTRDLDSRLTDVVDNTGTITRRESKSYTPTGAVATRSMDNRSLQTAPPVMTWQQAPGAASCTPGCGNRCGTTIPDGCGGTRNCPTPPGTTCSPEGYVIR